MSLSVYYMFSETSSDIHCMALDSLYIVYYKLSYNYATVSTYIILYNKSRICYDLYRVYIIVLVIKIGLSF